MMMMIIKILISALLIQLKLISAAGLLFVIIVSVESNRILQSKQFYIVEEKRYSTKWIYPQTISKIPEDMPLLTLIFVICHNAIFDITYNRIKHGRFFWIKNFNIKKMLTTLACSTAGVSRLTIYFIKFLFKIKTYTELIEEIFKLFNRDADARLIYNENNTWKINGKQYILWDIVLNKLIQNNIPDQSINAIKQKFFTIHFNLNDIKSIKYPHYEVKFINKDEPKVQHTLLQGLTKNSAFGGLQTSFNKAQKNNFYDKECLVYKYTSPKKEATLLHQDMSQIQIISEKKIETITSIITGAHIYGYNEDLLTPELRDAIQQINIFEEEIKKILLEVNCATVDLKFINDIVKSALLSIL